MSPIKNEHSPVLSSTTTHWAVLCPATFATLCFDKFGICFNNISPGMCIFTCRFMVIVIIQNFSLFSIIDGEFLQHTLYLSYFLNY